MLNKSREWMGVIRFCFNYRIKRGVQWENMANYN